MRKMLFAAIVAAGAVFAGAAAAAPTPAQTPAGFEHSQGGQVEQVRHGGRGWHRGWGRRHHGWRRGHHYGWRHGRRHHRRYWR